jgi:hypothetical protein
MEWNIRIQNYGIWFEWYELQARNHYRGLQFRPIFVSIHNERKNLVWMWANTYIYIYLCRLGHVGFSYRYQRFRVSLNSTLLHFAHDVNKAQASGITTGKPVSSEPTVVTNSEISSTSHHSSPRTILMAVNCICAVSRFHECLLFRCRGTDMARTDL